MGYILRKALNFWKFYELQGRCVITLDDGEEIYRSIPPQYFRHFGFKTEDYYGPNDRPIVPDVRRFSDPEPERPEPERDSEE